MANKDDTAPATKTDLQNLHREIGREIRGEAEETRRHFDVVAEKLYHDFVGAFRDRTSQHDDKLRNLEDRMQVIERKLGVVA